MRGILIWLRWLSCRATVLPDTMHYDAHNRMVEFSTGSGGAMKTWNLKYGPLGRVYRKEEYLGESSPVIQSATHYYYQGSALVQEYDEMLTGAEWGESSAGARPMGRP